MAGSKASGPSHQPGPGTIEPPRIASMMKTSVLALMTIALAATAPTVPARAFSLSPHDVPVPLARPFLPQTDVVPQFAPAPSEEVTASIGRARQSGDRRRKPQGRPRCADGQQRRAGARHSRGHAGRFARPAHPSLGDRAVGLQGHLLRRDLRRRAPAAGLAGARCPEGQFRARALPGEPAGRPGARRLRQLAPGNRGGHHRARPGARRERTARPGRGHRAPPLAQRRARRGHGNARSSTSSPACCAGRDHFRRMEMLLYRSRASPGQAHRRPRQRPVALPGLGGRHPPAAGRRRR